MRAIVTQGPRPLTSQELAQEGPLRQGFSNLWTMGTHIRHLYTRAHARTQSLSLTMKGKL